MATPVSVHRERKESTDECIHCAKGWVYEVDPDSGEDVALGCPMCLGTGRKMSKAERIRHRADLDAHYSCLERS